MLHPFDALYLHIPFCTKRCAYCDFATQAAHVDDPAIDAALAQLINAVRRAAAAGLLTRVRTVYVGGGTPSFAGIKRLQRLFCALGSVLDMPTLEEVTVEVNPDSASPELFGMLSELGATRISLGVQSLDDKVLTTLGRVHDAQAALRALEQARSAFSNVSADVICGVMGQGEHSLSQTIEGVLEAGARHVSVYPLMVEEGTPLARRVEAGELPDVDDDVQANHMMLAAQLLERAGFERYEVASYALPGFESRHNTMYWTGKPYLGLGAGAASMLYARDLPEVLDAGVFEWNCPNPGPLDEPVGSRVRISCTLAHAYEFELLSPREAACEDAMLGMRMAQGIARCQLELMVRRAPRLLQAVNDVVNRGLAQWRDDRFVPTQHGWLMGNELYGALWGCALEE